MSSRRSKVVLGIAASLAGVLLACSADQVTVDAAPEADAPGPDLATDNNQLPDANSRLPEGAIELTTKPVKLGYRSLLWDGEAFLAFWVEDGVDDLERHLVGARIGVDGQLLVAPRRLFPVDWSSNEHVLWNDGVIAFWWRDSQSKFYAATLSTELATIDGPFELGEAKQLSVTVVPDGYDLLLQRDRLIRLQRFSPALVARTDPEVVVRSKHEGIIFWDAQQNNHVVLHRSDDSSYYRARLDPDNVKELSGSKLADTGFNQRGGRIYRDASGRLLYQWQEQNDTLAAFAFEEGDERQWGPSYVILPNRIADIEPHAVFWQDKLWLAWTNDDQLRQVQLGWIDPLAHEIVLQGSTNASGTLRAHRPVLAAGGSSLALMFSATYDSSQHLLLRFIP